MTDISERIAKHVEPLLETALADALRDAQESVLRVRSDAGARGMGQSSVVRLLTAKAIAESYASFAKRVCDETIRVHRVLGLPGGASASAALKSAIGAWLGRAVQAFGRPYGLGDAHSTVLEQLHQAHEQATKRYEGEANLYAEGVAAGTNPTSKDGAVTVVNIHAPVASVMTGSHARAIVTQDASTRMQNVLQVMNLVQAIVEASSSPHRDELLEIVEDVREVVTAPKPNGTKLRALLQALAAGVSGIANAEKAYDAIMKLLQALGLA